MNRKELSEVVTECAARSERAAVQIDEARAQQEAAIARQEAATARMEEIQAGWAERDEEQAERDKKQDELITEMRTERERLQKQAEAQLEAFKAEGAARLEEDRVWRREYLRRQEKMFQDFFKRTDAEVAKGRENTEKILAVIRDQQEDLKAMREAILKLIDRMPPPPPHLRSA